MVSSGRILDSEDRTDQQIDNIIPSDGNEEPGDDPDQTLAGNGDAGNSMGGNSTAGSDTGVRRLSQRMLGRSTATKYHSSASDPMDNGRARLRRAQTARGAASQFTLQDMLVIARAHAETASTASYS